MIKYIIVFKNSMAIVIEINPNLKPKKFFVRPFENSEYILQICEKFSNESWLSDEQ